MLVAEISLTCTTLSNLRVSDTKVGKWWQGSRCTHRAPCDARE